MYSRMSLLVFSMHLFCPSDALHQQHIVNNVWYSFCGISVILLADKSMLFVCDSYVIRM